MRKGFAKLHFQGHLSRIPCHCPPNAWQNFGIGLTTAVQCFTAMERDGPQKMPKKIHTSQQLWKRELVGIPSFKHDSPEVGYPWQIFVLVMAFSKQKTMASLIVFCAKMRLAALQTRHSKKGENVKQIAKQESRTHAK